MTHPTEPIPLERELLYLDRAEEVSKEVIEELGKTMVADIEAYTRDHDLHHVFMETVEHPTLVAVQDAEAILGVDEAEKRVAALRQKHSDQQPPDAKA